MTSNKRCVRVGWPERSRRHFRSSPTGKGPPTRTNKNGNNNNVALMHETPPTRGVFFGRVLMGTRDTTVCWRHIPSRLLPCGGCGYHDKERWVYGTSRRQFGRGRCALSTLYPIPALSMAPWPGFELGTFPLGGGLGWLRFIFYQLVTRNGPAQT